MVAVEEEFQAVLLLLLGVLGEALPTDLENQDSASVPHVRQLPRSRKEVQGSFEIGNVW